jgi:DNA-binding GntR family transcriptional regulator
MSKPPVRAQQLTTKLAAQIENGELPAGSWLPSERQLAESHAVGRSTARAAVQSLADLGLVQLVAGSGAQVLRRSDLTDGELRQTLRQMNERLGDMDRRLAKLESARRSEPTP